MSPALSKTPLLAVVAGSLGDSILTLPALQALSGVRRVTVAGTPPLQTLGPALLGVGDVKPFEAVMKDPALADGFTEALLFLKAGADETAAVLARRNLSVASPSLSFDAFLRERLPAHLYWNRAVSQQYPGLPFPGPPRLSLDVSFLEEGRRFFGGMGLSNPIILHPGSGGRRKNAPLSFFHQAARAAKDRGLDVLVVWGEAEADRIAEIRGAFTPGAGCRVLDDPLPLRTLAGALAASCGYAGCDSGVTHLAAACGVPALAVFGPTDPRVWAPPMAVTISAGPAFGVLAEVDFSPVLEGFLDRIK